MKICLRLLIFELSDCTLRIFRGYDFSNFLILLILDRYFEVFDSDLRASPSPVCLAMECPPALHCEVKNAPCSHGPASVWGYFVLKFAPVQAIFKIEILPRSWVIFYFLRSEKCPAQPRPCPGPAYF